MSDDNDMVFEADSEEEGGTTAEALQKKLKKIKIELAASNVEKQQYLDGWQRAKADYVNIKKRTEDERQSLVREASLGLVEALLPVLDSFEHALEAPNADEKWLQGITNTYTQLKKTLEGEGLVFFDPLGEKFDPARHEPVGTVAVEEESSDNTVTKVYQSGYTLHGKVIRPARVAVGHYKS